MTRAFKTIIAAILAGLFLAGAWAAAGAGTPAAGGRAHAVAVAIQLAEAPPARVTWGNPRTLQDHYDRHGADFGASSPNEYARMAWEFLQRARTEGLRAKRDAQGVLRVYDPNSRAFAAYNRDGTTRTFFKATRRDYFDRQPGELVDLRR